MFTARATSAIVFFIFAFRAFSQVACTTILLHSEKGQGLMFIANDQNVGPVVVTGTQIQDTVIPKNAALTLRFDKPGEVNVKERDTVIIQALINERYFCHVRTHTKASLYRKFGPISIYQRGEVLRLTIGGGDFPGHFLTLNQSPDDSKQNISISSDNIIIDQSSKQKNQNLSIKDGSESIVLSQDTTPEFQNLSFGGQGAFSTLVNKAEDCIMITQTNTRHYPQ